MVIRRFVLFLLFGLISANGQWDDPTSSSCTTFNDKPGNCIQVKYCPRIRRILRKKHKTDEDINILSNVGCSGPSQSYVCCEEEYNEDGLKQLNQTENFETCGLFSDNKIMGGQEVDIHSRPWMALLKFQFSNYVGFGCGGSLITHRFVLTAAHCLTPMDRKLLQVRLGEHHIMQSRYCLRDTCERGYEDIDALKYMVHENFDKYSGQSDIALVKLARDVQYKNHIRPICLPITQDLRQMGEAQVVFDVIGWGMTESRPYSEVLLATSVHRQNCGYSSKIQICAGGGANDSCVGDSGGPLMYRLPYNEKQRFIQFGIVSSGPNPCATGSHAVYTSVTAFMSWITEKLMQ